MPISVICPGCHTRFKVGDQHGGKTGACPKCKGPIEIPKVEDQVVIHAPELEAGSVDSKGRSVLKPIARKQAKLKTNALIVTIGGTLLTFAIAFLAGKSLEPNQYIWALTTGAILLGPPLAYAAYSFLKDDELGAYEGSDLLVRCLACGLVYALLWGVYMYVANQLFDENYQTEGLEMVQIAMLVVPLLGIGTFAAFVSFDLEPITGFFHFALFFGVTVLLRATMGLDFLPGLVLGGS